MPAEEVAEWRERTRSFLLNHDARFDLGWRKFFYIDELPQNAARFGFTLEFLLLGGMSLIPLAPDPSNETEIAKAVDVSAFF